MADKYPLDITLLCSIGLEGGLKHYKNVLPDFSREELDIVHDWNIALKKNAKKPEYKSKLGSFGKLCLYLKPEIVAKIIDKFAVPYRSYYYAKRFLDAANFVSQKNDALSSTKIVDFGRGLSPWGPVVKNRHPWIEMYTFDTPLTDNLFIDTTKSAGFELPKFNTEPENINFEKDMFVSLGTFVYLDYDEQVKKMKYAKENFKNIFIELEKENAQQQDKNIVNNMGTDYHQGWNCKKVYAVFNGGTVYQIKSLLAPQDEELLAEHRYTKTLNAAKQATEIFLVR